MKIPPPAVPARRLLPLAVALGVTSAAAQQDLPLRDPDAPLDFEPALRLYEVPPDAGGKAVVPWEAPLPEAGKARAEADRAQRKAERWRQLQRRGVVSKAEAELAGVQASRALLRFQQAQIAALRAQLTALAERAARGEASPDLLATARNDLASAEQRLLETEALARRNDLEFAQNQLERQRKLVAAGVGSKTLLKRAQAEVQRAQAATPPPAVPSPAKP